MRDESISKKVEAMQEGEGGGGNVHNCISFHCHVKCTYFWERHRKCNVYIEQEKHSVLPLPLIILE